MELIGGELGRQQEMLFAMAKAESARPARRVLLVLQAMDCGGKDGTVKRVAGAMNPLGLHIRSFGPPTAGGAAARLPVADPPGAAAARLRRGVQPVALRGRADRPGRRRWCREATWRARYDEINAFERELADGGVTVVKVMLHISYAEQRRAAAGAARPTRRKHWKYNPADLDARARWDDYQAAYAEALSRCGTDAAPWFVVPADRKWYRDWAVAHLLRETFDDA